jgi:hypothetical protein
MDREAAAVAAGRFRVCALSEAEQEIAMETRDDFDGLARRYWQAWGDALRQGAEAGGVPGWSEALQWWGGLAQGGGAQADEAVRRASAAGLKVVTNRCTKREHARLIGRRK